MLTTKRLMVIGIPMGILTAQLMLKGTLGFKLLGAAVFVIWFILVMRSLTNKS